MISGKTVVYGIFGYPVEHTFSPGMHNAAFAHVGMDACYVPFAVPADRLAEAMRGVIPLGIRGLNITVPHKEKIIPLLDELTEDARLIRAVNTIAVKNGRLIGHNTDGRGFLRSLREETSFRPKGKTVLIVGAGGAARAVGFSLALAGVGELRVSDTDHEKALRLAKDIRERTSARTTAWKIAKIDQAMADASCVINATPMGLKKTDPLPVPRACIRSGQLICDLVYNPPSTKLLKTATSRGAATLSGIGMLLYQGVIAFEIWSGRRAPVHIMQNMLKHQMQRGLK
jgi:shikimate dehydrogenase